MLKSSDWSTGEPEIRVIVSPWARFVIQRRLRITSNVTGSRSGSTSSWKTTRPETRVRQSAEGT